MYGYDAAYAPDLAAVKAAGGIAVNGYLTGRYASTTTQPAAALASGLGWWATYEEDPAELVHATREQGQAVARKILDAYTAKRDHHGRPLPLDGTAAVYPSVDVEVAAGDAAACDQAWLGLRDVLAGKLSLRYYGEGLVGAHLYRNGLVDGPWWLAAPTSWPGYDVTLPDICAVQLVGTDVPGTDRNHLITNPSALGAIWPDGSPYARGELTMDAEVQAAFAAQGHKIDVLFDLVHSALSPVIDGKPTQVSVDTIVARRTAPLAAQNAALQAQVNALAKLQAGESLTADEVRAEAKQGAEDALAGYQLTLTPPAAK